LTCVDGRFVVEVVGCLKHRPGRFYPDVVRLRPACSGPKGPVC
jgi:hypothetical protein